ncbi:hypothetical protein [Blastococcus goldschmidtiae]|uniref:Uncharacterized protein n=1 Tax=Blastococcus goldschmidtiae TaxID=3075546 RepID=A0ABU2K8G9_9ACTN|nr:hypothetical protein [Blastococcus sp. DSM 46792]MDT0276463.1 hypothetical protein [Blastococcus sp. DSM 46792]
MAVQDRMTPRNLYLYLVCLIMLVVSLVAVVQLVRSAIGIAYPEDVMGYGWTAYEDPSVIGGVDEEFLSAEQNAAKDSLRRSEIVSTVTAGLTLLLAGGLFALHWHRAQSERLLPAAAPEVPAATPTP